MSLAAIAGTVGGWLAMEVAAAPPADAALEVAGLEPLPALEPVVRELPPEPAAQPRRPRALATTRSSR
jgi:hypothetical protein